MFRFQPDLLTWRKTGKGVYESLDGLQRVEKQGNVWAPAVRDDVSQAWSASKHVFGALHAAQDECRRMLAKARASQAPQGDTACDLPNCQCSNP